MALDSRKETGASRKEAKHKDLFSDQGNGVGRFGGMKTLFLILATSALSLSAAKRPNILFIFTDDHAYQAVGAYDSWLKEHCPTPNIDSLARDGMLFEQC